MDCKIIFSTKATKELHESFKWYENRSVGLGVLFVQFIDKTIRLIELNPEGYPNKVGPYREVAFSKFPYLLIYEFVKETQTVYILHVFHTKRNPKHKYKKK